MGGRVRGRGPPEPLVCKGALGAQRGRGTVRRLDAVAAVRGGRALLLERSQRETGQAAAGLEMRDAG